DGTIRTLSHQKIATAEHRHIAGRLLGSANVGDFGQLRQITAAAVTQSYGIAFGRGTALDLADLYIELGNVGQQAVDRISRGGDLLIGVIVQAAHLAVES